MKNSLFYTMLEMASNYHNAIMAGNKWDDEKQDKAIKSIFNQICDLYGVDLEKWLDTLNDCEPIIENNTDLHPGERGKEIAYNNVIDELYNVWKIKGE